MKSLVGLIFAIWVQIHPLATRAPDAPVIAEGIAQAALDDPLPPLTGSVRGDVALMAEYTYRESSLQVCGKPGDGGKSWGEFQLQRLTVTEACNPYRAPVIWLQRAHNSMNDCSKLPVPEQLAELVSGSCQRGHNVASRRWLEGWALLGNAP